MKHVSCALIFCLALLACISAKADEGARAVTPKPGDSPASAIIDSQPSVPTEKSDTYNDIAEGQVDIKNSIDNPTAREDLADGQIDTAKAGENPDPLLQGYLKGGINAGNQDNPDGNNSTGGDHPPADNHGTLLDNLPPELKQYAAEIDQKAKSDGLNYFDENVKNVTYNSDGTIKSVTLDDGMAVSYSYERDRDGGLTSCSIEAGGITLVFRLDKPNDDTISEINYASTNNNGANESNKPATIEIYINGGEQDKPVDHGNPSISTTRPDSSNKPILVYSGKTAISPEDVSRTPEKFDFNSIKTAISQAEGIKEGALKNYEKSSASYYNEVEKVLIKNGIQSNDKSGAARREVVDKAVADAYSASAKGSGSEASQEITAKEKILRGKILIPALAEYNSRIKEAQGDIDNMIDKLINSKLALYLDAKKDKVDAIIKLPNIKK